ncbi:MAG TPA: replication-associated recombination protein A, partial [Smithella sp.]|nr:replication-associated recombination protein A [Smithella sp.]
MKTLDLFDQGNSGNVKDAAPLAERMRPQNIYEYIGQKHLLGEGSLLKRAIESDKLFSMIFWGPPGSGKTTLARILANETKSKFVSFSAVLSGVKEIRAVIDEARELLERKSIKTILFVDEIHRFNKAQQDAFLPHVESGLITLIGATTENPSFEVIAPLLSRTRVLVLKPFSEENLLAILEAALKNKQKGLGNIDVKIDANVLRYLVSLADGDARSALNNLEVLVSMVQNLPDDQRAISLKFAQDALLKKSLLYDKDGEEHYNLISALHKSLRGSDPDAALYWLGRMLAAGEDPLYIARRMIRFASEDIGNADPKALIVAVAAQQAFHFIGLPEGELALAQAAVYLATAPKSNALYVGCGKVKNTINTKGYL